ncbi:DtxR family Mn-dependent transcriptional regulator [Pedobacter sp. CG_S7]|uniref:metal-dependent transcriptional regulator n=1 Tax=Pedobacter sp. CG_S7 TaxID=3143930 RepID=UPI0033994355
MLSITEENYIKALLKIGSQSEEKAAAGINELSAHLGVKPATATDMFKKLKEKKLVDYKKYGKISLTEEGRNKALSIVRKHRLWETFLFQKLGFTWDEVHEVAEQLEHIKSPKLVSKLEEYLDFPEFDPHGDPIPKANGEMVPLDKMVLSDLKPGDTCIVVAVKDTSILFLKYLEKLGVNIGTQIKVIEKVPFDSSLLLTIEDQEPRNVSIKFSESLFVRK